MSSLPLYPPIPDPFYSSHTRIHTLLTLTGLLINADKVRQVFVSDDSRKKTRFFAPFKDKANFLAAVKYAERCSSLIGVGYSKLICEQTYFSFTNTKLEE